MSTINHFIANSSGELTELMPLIELSLQAAIPIAQRELSADAIDIIFVSAAALAMTEYGIGGNSPGPNHIYISFDPESNRITKDGLVETLLHEIHHCMRWRSPGYGDTLGEAMVTEGLACLYESEHSGKVPVYAQVSLKDNQIKEAKETLNSKDYDHARWFFGSQDIPRWLGYTLGYKLCKLYSDKHHKTATELCHAPASNIIDSSNWDSIVSS